MLNFNSLTTPLRMIPLRELLETNFPETEPLLAPWLGHGEQAMLWAPTGIGKSWLAMSIALAVAGGGSVGSWSASDAHRVWLIDGEMSRKTIKERVLTLLDSGAVCVDDREATIRNFDVTSADAQDLNATFYDISSPTSFTHIIETCRERGVGLLILDNYSTLTPGLRDENNADDVKDVQVLLRGLRQVGTACLLVHHSGKTGSSYRGSSNLATTFEKIIGLEPCDDADDLRASFKIKFHKSRDLCGSAIEPRKWTLRDNGWHVAGPSNDNPADCEVFKAVKSRAFSSQREIMEHCLLKQPQVSKIMKKWREAGFLTKEECNLKTNRKNTLH